MKLEVKELYKSFYGNSVLEGISFSVESGMPLGLLGRNGAGKTTIIRIIMNLFKANKGQILLDGKEFNPKDYRVGYLPEERGLYPKKKVLEQLIYLGQLRGLKKKVSKENALYWLDRLDVEQYQDRVLETLSKGNQQKVQLAEVFLTNPDIIILDEPFSGLDPVNSQILKGILQEIIREKKLLIFSSHQMNYVEEFCDSIALIDKGNIVLTGKLKDKQNEYGMNRLTVSASNQSLEDFRATIERELSHMARVVAQKKDVLILELTGKKTQNDFLKDLMEEDVVIEHFSLYKPSLEDIFVAKVGESE
ncbi:MAG: ATP-binding cassette domain-containing protein [Peptostreptococcales bacterium]|jgi:ABC-2 type transport system ATP-binding protein